MEFSPKIPFSSGHRFCASRAHKTLTRLGSTFYCHANSCAPSGHCWSYVTSPECYRLLFNVFLQWCLISVRHLDLVKCAWNHSDRLCSLCTDQSCRILQSQIPKATACFFLLSNRFNVNCDLVLTPCVLTIDYQRIGNSTVSIFRVNDGSHLLRPHYATTQNTTTNIFTAVKLQTSLSTVPSAQRCSNGGAILMVIGT